MTERSISLGEQMIKLERRPVLSVFKWASLQSSFFFFLAWTNFKKTLQKVLFKFLHWIFKVSD